MMPQVDPLREAQRLRTQREAFEAALATGTTIADARFAIATARWAARDAQRGRCGTEAHGAGTPLPIPTDQAEAEKELFWWQKL